MIWNEPGRGWCCRVVYLFQDALLGAAMRRELRRRSLERKMEGGCPAGRAGCPPRSPPGLGPRRYRRFVSASGAQFRRCSLPLSDHFSVIPPFFESRSCPITVVKFAEIQRLPVCYRTQKSAVRPSFVRPVTTAFMLFLSQSVNKLEYY